MLEFIDSHAHIYQPSFDQDISVVVQRSLEAGVNRIVLPNIDLESVPRVLALSRMFPDVCLPTIGLHPCDVKEDFESVLQQLRDIAFQPTDFPNAKIFAIGETGLDYYWDTTFVEEQKRALVEQISWSKTLQLPIILHTRNSIQDTINIIAEHHDEHLTGVFHCFSGNLSEAKQIVELNGFYLGIGGTITYKNSTLPEVLKDIPMEKIMLETDAPYLTPVPHRGKRNESAYIPLVAQKIAEIKGVSIEEVAEKTTYNAKQMFAC